VSTILRYCRRRPLLLAAIQNVYRRRHPILSFFLSLEITPRASWYRSTKRDGGACVKRDCITQRRSIGDIGQPGPDRRRRDIEARYDAPCEIYNTYDIQIRVEPRARVLRICKVRTERISLSLSFSLRLFSEIVLSAPIFIIDTCSR
jgi:hypothetical protein